MNRPFHRRTRTAAATVAVVAIGVIAGCSSSSSSSSSSSAPATATAAASGAAASSASSSASTGTVSTTSCGTKPGVVATGTPINLGSINTDQPGTSFTDISNMAAAYFTCVNDNGGINGHPIKLFQETDQTQPAQIQAAAKKLVQS